MALAVTVAGVDRSQEAQLPSLSLLETCNGQNTLGLEFLSKDGAFRPPMDAEIIVTDGAERLFAGYIRTPDEAPLGPSTSPSPTAIVTAVSCPDYTLIAQRRRITLTIAAGTTLKAALQAMGTALLTAEGCTLHPDQVVGPTLPELRWTRVKLQDAFDELVAAASAGGTSHLWGFDYVKRYRVWAVGELVAPWNVAPGDGHIIGAPIVTPSQEGYANRVEVICGGDAQIARTHTATADGGTHPDGKEYFAVPYPVPVDISIPWPNVVTVSGYGTVPVAWGDDAVFAWYWDFSANPGRMVHRDSDPEMGQLAAGTSVSFSYTQQCPFSVLVDDPTEQGLHGVWEGEEPIEAPEATDIATGQAFAAAELGSRTSRAKAVRYTTYTPGLAPGQVQTINLPSRGLTAQTVLIQQVLLTFAGALLRVYQITATTGTTYTDRYAGAWRPLCRSLAATGGRSSSSASAAVASPSVPAATSAPDVHLGGSRIQDVDDAASPAWKPIPEAATFRCRATGTYALRTERATRAAGTTVRVRLYDLTAASEVKVGAWTDVTDFEEEILAVSLTVGHRYQVQVQASTAAASVRVGQATMEL